MAVEPHGSSDALVASTQRERGRLARAFLHNAGETPALPSQKNGPELSLRPVKVLQ